MNIKNDYEFATNYDFDEFIFPRIFKTNDFSTFAQLDCNSLNNKQSAKNYNLYDYAVRLKNEHGQDAACFEFESVAFIKQIQSFIKNTLLTNLLNNNQSNFRFEMEENFVKYSMNETDRSLIASINQFQSLINCLNKSIATKNVYSHKWNIPFATLIKTRPGKSLFDTKLTHAINQHGIGVTGMSCIKVPIEVGFVSHFRDDIKCFFSNQSYPLNYIQLDLEYYFFLHYLND
jgi:hypothetical protein